jgi:hypothetical protein
MILDVDFEHMVYVCIYIYNNIYIDRYYPYIYILYIYISIYIYIYKWTWGLFEPIFRAAGTRQEAGQEAGA